MARPSRDLLAWGAVALPAVGLGLSGAVGAAERAGLAGLVAVVLAGLALRGTAGRGALRVGLAGLPVALALAVGLVPVPRGVLEAVAPGIAAARPDPVWTLSLRPAETAVALATWAAVLGAAVAVAATWDRDRLARGLAWATVAWAAVGAAHGLLGADRLFGLVPIRRGVDVWLAPLVNPNHHGAVLLAGLPFAAREAWRSRGRPLRAAVLALPIAWALAVPFVARSMGSLLGLGVLAVAAVATGPGPVRTRVAAVVALGAAGAAGALALVRLQPEWWIVSAAPRLAQWRDTLALIADHPLAGAGAGTYRAAFAPYRTIPAFLTFDHAHADPLEWLAETGAVGVLAAWAALALLPRARGDLRPWTLGLLALGAHALVDFPLHVPGVAVFAAVLVAARQAAAPEPAPAPPPWGRLVLVALALANLVGAAVLADRAREDADVARLRAGGSDPTVVARLAARGRPEADVARLSAAWDPDEARRAASRHADDGLTLARLAALAHRAGDARLARELLDRAVVREPHDFRAWRLLSDLRAAEGDRSGAAVAWAEALRHWAPDRVGDGEALDRALALVPVPLWWVDALHDAPAHWSIRLAGAALARGDADTALLACEQAARLRPVVFGRAAACAEARLRLGDADGALAYLRDWLAERPDDLAARLAAVRLGPELPEGHGLWQRALVEAWALAPGDPRVCRWLDEPLRARCSHGDPTLQSATCALAEVARAGRGTRDAAVLAALPAFRVTTADPWVPCPR